MKKNVILFVALLTFSFTMYSQTTQDEYNYLTKDYVVKRNEPGFELKKGYAMENLFFNDADTTSITMQKFVRVDGSNKIAVAYLLGYKKGKNPTEFTIIPHPKSEEAVNNAFWKSLNNGKAVSSEKFQYIISTIARQLIW